MKINLEESYENLEKLEIELLLQGLYAWCGYDYRNYAFKSIQRRIWHRVHAEKLTSITGLLEKVLHDSDCLKRLIADFSINVTEMFRDPLFFFEFRRKGYSFIAYISVYQNLACRMFNG